MFWESNRVIDKTHKIAGTDIPGRHIVENVLMVKEPEDIISEQMGGRPTKIPAGPVCASNRDRCFRIEFTITPFEGGAFGKRTIQKQTHLKA